jgi:hypothetical protein
LVATTNKLVLAQLISVLAVALDDATAPSDLASQLT